MSAHRFDATASATLAVDPVKARLELAADRGAPLPPSIPVRLTATLVGTGALFEYRFLRYRPGGARVGAALRLLACANLRVGDHDREPAGRGTGATRRVERRLPVRVCGVKRSNQPILTKEALLEIPSIAFVGVWDTVAAYGFPIAEITKGIDRWVWPLSMPDYKLSKKVRCARHALALDDERDTFHPLLWNEVNERNLVESGDVSADPVRQVWFAGMHSDVGGGYSDDSLAHVSLVWMAKEAMKAGLRLRSDALAEFETRADALGPIHDSRSGMAA